LDQKVQGQGIRSMSIESLLKHILNPIQLTTVFENGVLKITTATKAGEKLTTRLYPVSDLIQSTRSTDYSLMVNADLDRELLWNRRTGAVHAEIEEMLDRLGDLPPAFGKNSGLVPARIPDIGPDDVTPWDMNSLMNLISSVIQPDTWEDLSGPGSMFPHLPKLVLAIRQTQSVHVEVRALLTGLRRARFLARQGRSWKSFDLAQGPEFFAVIGLTNLAVGTRQSELPHAEPDELAALAVLNESPAGVQIWRARAPTRAAQTPTIIRSSHERSEFEFDGRLARVDGDEAMVAYPGLALVERGNWGEAIRRIVDGRLPWLPHRSHAELARLFRIKVAAQDDETVQLQFELPGAAGSAILVTVSRKLKMPVKWESRLDGRLVMRLRFEDLVQAAGASIWRTVIAEDESNREIERWELVSYSRLESDIPALADGWKADLMIDVRDQDLVIVPPALRMLQAVRLRDWKVADTAISAALADQPGQPFLLLVKAWALSQRQGNHAAEFVNLLHQVAGSGRGDLLEPISEASFAVLGGDAIYDILLAQPVERRRPRDWDQLARNAVRTGRAREAVGHLKEALRQTVAAPENFERTRWLVELLLQTGHAEEAMTVAEEDGERQEITPEEVATLAETLHKGGAKASAAKMMRELLSRPELTGERRHRLLIRRAGLEEGMVRWRTII
ncbi:MAG TPA: hypothetical protein VGH74_08525, partial [Planctomycetaceae bacterium]